MAIYKAPSSTVKSMHRTGADFLRIDSEVALTLSAMALAATDEETKRRRTMVARKAYDTIAHLRERVELTNAERQILDANMRRVKSALQSLGQIL
jgi:hypothetical protein